MYILLLLYSTPQAPYQVSQTPSVVLSAGPSLCRRLEKMRPAKSKQGESLLEGIRLVINASLPDEELEVKAEAVEQELEAIDQALADEGTYLGIVDKVMRRSVLPSEQSVAHTPTTASVSYRAKTFYETEHTHAYFPKSGRGQGGSYYRKALKSGRICVHRPSTQHLDWAGCWPKGPHYS